MIHIYVLWVVPVLWVAMYGKYLFMNNIVYITLHDTYVKYRNKQTEHAV